MPYTPPPPPEAQVDPARGVKGARERIERLLTDARKAVQEVMLVQFGLEKRVGEFIAEGRKLEDMGGTLWRPLTMTKMVVRDLEKSSHDLGTFLQELDWAIDPNPDFLPQHLERARIAGNKDQVAMIAEAMGMRKAWMEATRPKDSGTRGTG